MLGDIRRGVEQDSPQAGRLKTLQEILNVFARDQETYGDQWDHHRMMASAQDCKDCTKYLREHVRSVYTFRVSACSTH